MSYAPKAPAVDQLVKARLNLLAVLPNLEDVVRDDPEMHRLVGDARLVVRFVVARGPDAFVRFADGACTVGEGTPADGHDPSIVLYFASASHLNRMFDGKAPPIPLRGLRRLKFLQGPFTELTERMGYYLTPTDELLDHPGYLAMNTRLTLNTAAFAVPQLLDGDPDCRPLRHALSRGTVVLKVLPDGPSVHIVFGPSSARPGRGELPDPSALVLLPSLQIANDFLNGKLDTFAAVAKGDVEIWGQIGLIDALGLVLDRVGKYLTPAAAPATTG
jgi:hypothetical protein